jgi:hypothetical protein
MNPSEPDDRLARRVADTLDRQARQTDPELESRLESVLLRPERPKHRRHATGWWAMGGMALAAGLSALLWLPASLPTSVPPTPVQAQTSTPSVEPEFLEDMELIAALGEDPYET